MRTKMGRWGVFFGMLVLLGFGGRLPPAAAQEVRTRANFNAGWKLSTGDPIGAEKPDFRDASWKAVTLPHAWNEDFAFKASIYELPTGIAWYRKRFVLPVGSATTDRKAFLEFEGVRMAGEVYVNGTFVGRSENGVMAFGLDITRALLPAGQENVVAVRTDNAWNYHTKEGNAPFQWNDRNFYANYGGINKNVFLHVTGKLYQTLPLYSNLGTSGVYVYANNFDVARKTATITAESEVKNEFSTPRTFRYSATLIDADGKTVQTLPGDEVTVGPGRTATARASGRVTGLHFWSWGYGYLYTVRTTLTVGSQIVDAVSTRTGFRKTEFAHGMVRLNDRALHLKGYAQRTTNEWPAVGLSVPAWLSDFSNRMMVEGNANLVRWMHVTPWKQDVESCDRVGLLESLPAGDSEADVTGTRWEARKGVMRDAIIYHRNSPSILFYESGNNGVSDAHMAEMKALRDTWDAHGGRASGSRNMMGSRVAEYGGEMLYINKSATKPLWAMEYSRDEALRKWQDDFTPPFHKDGVSDNKTGKGPSYNRNQDTFAIEDVVRWYDYWRERPGTGDRVNAGGVNIIFSDSNTHFRGDQNYRRSGEVDAVRLPKDGYFAHQVMWDGWVDVEKPRAFLIGHWNYAPGTRKAVTVVAGGVHRVELFLNGKSLGVGTQSSEFLWTFPDVLWQAGTLRAVGYDAGGKTMCSTEKTTAGPPFALRLTPHISPSGWEASGADMALVDVEVVDKNGLRCPTALDMVHFALTGPAEFRGGIAQANDRPDNFVLSPDLPVECGINRVLLRSQVEAGAVTVRATSGGLAPASLSLITHAPSAALPPLASFLGRGPTPSGDGLTQTRRSVPVARATAGTNADKAALSFDDNETTGWSNADGLLETAWVAYELAHPATLSEVTLKLAGWRNRGYPVRITVDGQEVFRGETPRSLGYVTLPLKPVKGKTVRIALIGAASEGDGFGLVEITGKTDAAGAPAATPPAPNAKKAGAKGTLNIIEVEWYEPAE